MPWSIHVADDRSYITLRIVGAGGRPGFEGVLAAHAKGKELGIRSFLVDLTEATNEAPAVDDYEMAYSDFPTGGIDRFAAVVGFVRPGDHSHDFLATAFRNAGLRIELFDDRAQALSGLLDSRPDDTAPSPAAP